ncbi:hypothetical protein QNH36_11140 [Mesobacillus sp. AQ2]|jgi:hypothetical protein|uniref:hypothetical protein n=1 Tax=unclassified Mesobacillus TaxID=2675270 RepID=UPI002041C1DC|nr:MULTISPECIES: hypothetical protein [unclassified Mesobacillus]MCM3122912.1 hypothetical protein [Mesobacillus sp. MER 33]MCM3233605.1 hypothetical protein [Mesobacillus sp. MER 48]WHX42641.1 hypothetical protein QNH36_11140 [Mesobacillus sp. AQ2]
MKTKEIKEPIRKKWIWILLALNVLLVVPWYFPKGDVQPIILGFPVWAFVSLVFSLILCGYSSWLCITQWNIVEDIEEADKKKEANK